VTITTSTLKVYLRSTYTDDLMPADDQWRTLTVRLPKAHYDFAQAVLQRVADLEGVRHGTAFLFILQDWLLSPEHDSYNPDLGA
jgi:hypothetical protein